VRFLALVGVFAAFQVWWFQRETPTEQRLGAAASSVAGKSVDVRCPSIWRRLIDVSSSGGTAHYDAEGRPAYARLAHDVCETFETLAERGFPKDIDCLAQKLTACDAWVVDVAAAVHVLTHESWHLRGVLDEGTTECYAYQTDSAVAQRFGATRLQGELLAAFVESRGAAASLPQYRPPAGCNPGGRLDLHPETPNWPS
jgi:hypothetical protein